jgi:hypothetical protein
MSGDKPVNIDLRGFFNQYKHAHCSAYKLPSTDLLEPYESKDIEGYQLPNDFRHYLLNVSRELIAGATPTGPVFDISVNKDADGTFSSENTTYSGCLRIGTHIPDQCFHVIVTDKYHQDYGAVYLCVPNRNTKIKAWKDFTTYITSFVLKISESLSKQSTQKEE